MPTFPQKPSTNHKLNTRSITLPVRSHPTTQRTEQELSKLKVNNESLSSSSKATTIRNALCGLGDLYKCVKELLDLPLTRQALALHRQEKWIQELLDDSLEHLDFCGNARDAISAAKESVRGLQSAIRRRKVVGDSSAIESDVVAYTRLRKAMKKEIGHGSKRTMDNKHNGGLIIPLDLDGHSSSVVRVLREASLVTSSVFRSLSRFLSTHVLKARPRKWSLVSMMVRKGVLGSYCDEDKSVNELESVDIALGELLLLAQNSSSEGVEDEKIIIESALRKLEALEGVMEGLENGLETLFRLFINNRVCLLNVLSQ